MYFPDLHSDCPGVFRVGYLQRGMPYRKGPVAEKIVNKLRVLADKPINLTRGFHCCDLCSVESGVIGNGDIRVVLDLATAFVAPVMIGHYIIVHGYLPPADFLLAVEKSK